MKKTRVVFKTMEGEIIALFPDIHWNTRNGQITCYTTKEQHHGADSDLLNTLPTPNETEYQPLLKEIADIYYNEELIPTTWGKDATT